MICFVVTEAGSFSIRTFLGREGATLGNRVRVITYPELHGLRALPLASWVFSAVDQLGAAERTLVSLVWDRLREADAPVRLINDPRAVLLRAALLRAAHEQGWNEFRAIPVLELNAATVLRYPVFVREAGAHTGSLTALLPDRTALERALARLRMRGHALAGLLVVEFCDTSDSEGVYRKYSACILGDRILPRYLNASRTWMVKQEGRIYQTRFAEAELEFLETHPHAAWLQRVFAHARIGYGRIDYGVHNGRPQVWEINTNPTIGRAGKPRVRPPEEERYRAIIAPARDRFYAAFVDAWRAIDSTATGTIAFHPPDSLLRDLRAEHARQAASWAAAIRHVGRWRLARRLAHQIEPLAATLLRIGYRVRR